jgi:hypothetical protein
MPMNRGTVNPYKSGKSSALSGGHDERVLPINSRRPPPGVEAFIQPTVETVIDPERIAATTG